jgi:hypothetical protein
MVGDFVDPLRLTQPIPNREIRRAVIPCLKAGFGGESGIASSAIHLRNAAVAFCASFALLTPSSRCKTSVASPSTCWSICSRIKPRLAQWSERRRLDDPGCEWAGSMAKSVRPLLHAAERREDDQHHHQAAAYKERSILEQPILSAACPCGQVRYTLTVFL